MPSTDPQTTPRDRIRHFLATVADYEQLESIYPLHNSIHMFGHREDNERRWQVVLHAMLLRKYFQPTDKLNLRLVVGYLRKIAPDEGEHSASWDELAARVSDVRSVGTYIFGERPPLSDAEILEAQLYGRYLHGDYLKWKTTVSAGDSGSDSAILFATLARAKRVKSLASYIQSGIDEGLLSI